MILDKLDFPVFDEDFTLSDEAGFITGLNMWGIDNYLTLCENLQHDKDCKDLFVHFYSYYYDIFAMTDSHNDPIKKLKEIRYSDSAHKAINAVLSSLAITKNQDSEEVIKSTLEPGQSPESAEAKIKTNEDIMKKNDEKCNQIAIYTDKEFETVCAIGKDKDRVSRSTRGRTKMQNYKNK